MPHHHHSSCNEYLLGMRELQLEKTLKYLLNLCPQIKRLQARVYFDKAISDMYSELSTSDPTPQKKL